MFSYTSSLQRVINLFLLIYVGIISKLLFSPAMAVPMLTFSFWWVFCAFLVLEAMVGMFNSCGATLRSKHYPDSCQSSIMTVFRLPLNALVVLGTKLTDRASDVPSLQKVFAVLVGMHMIALLFQIGLMTAPTHDRISISSDGVEKKKVQ